MAAAAGDGASAPVRVSRPADERALAELYARWSPFVYSLALRSLHDVDDAEEATYRVFTRAWTSTGALDPVGGPVPGRLVEIAREEIDVLAAARRQPPRVELASAALPPGGDTGPAALADQVTTLDGIARLDPVPRRALRMALHDDLDHEEIAERMGQPVEDVRNHLRRALEALRSRLEVQTGAR